MDHHCVWINNCVGASNGKYFLQYMCLTPIGIILFIFIEIFGLLISLGHVGNSPLIDFSTIGTKEIVDLIC